MFNVPESVICRRCDTVVVLCVGVKSLNRSTSHTKVFANSESHTFKLVKCKDDGVNARMGNLGDCVGDCVGNAGMPRQELCVQ